MANPGEGLVVAILNEAHTISVEEDSNRFETLVDHRIDIFRWEIRQSGGQVGDETLDAEALVQGTLGALAASAERTAEYHESK